MAPLQGDQTTRRLLVYLLLDCSDSPSKHLQDLERAAFQLIAELNSEPGAFDGVLLSIITFGDRAGELFAPTRLADIDEIILDPGSGCVLGAALTLLSESVERHRLDSTPPLVFLLSRGQATDDWETGAKRIKQTGISNVVVGAVGPDIDFGVLRAISQKIVDISIDSLASIRPESGWISAAMADVASFDNSTNTESLADLGGGEGSPSDEPLYMDENVQFTLYRPRAVVPEKWYSMLAFAHLSEKREDASADEPDPIEEVRKQARGILGDDANDYQNLTQDTSQAIPREGTITFVPAVAGIEFNPPSRSFTWKESVHREEFRLRVRASHDGRVLKGHLSVFLGSILLADIPLSIRADKRLPAGKEKGPLDESHARPYRKIFASYSHRDIEVVEQFEHYVEALGDRYLRDIRNLRAGEEWSNKLEEMIVNADVFQLFWSRNSMNSRFVKQEWEYALSLSRANFIRPTYWEDPLPAQPEKNLPPEELARLHFQRIGGKSAQPPRASSSASAQSVGERASSQTSASRTTSSLGPRRAKSWDRSVAASKEDSSVAGRTAASREADQRFSLRDALGEFNRTNLKPSEQSPGSGFGVRTTIDRENKEVRREDTPATFSVSAARSGAAGARLSEGSPRVARPTTQTYSSRPGAPFKNESPTKSLGWILPVVILLLALGGIVLYFLIR